MTIKLERSGIMVLPVIDSRDATALIQQFKEMYPFYTPEWRFSPEDPDPGTALFLIFTEMFQETIKRFNRVPEKNFMAFLNLLNLKIFPAKPASACLCFKLSSSDSGPVYIPAGTQAAANSRDGGEPIIFETTRDMVISPASLQAVFNTSGKQDWINAVPDQWLQDIKVNERAGFSLFDFRGENLQEHVLYIAHKDLFNIKESALVELEIINSLRQFKEDEICRKLADDRYVEWSYGSEQMWKSFAQVSSEGNRLQFIKTERGLMEEQELAGNVNRWIRARVKGKLMDEIAEIDFSHLKLKAKYLESEGTGGLLPDRAFYNDIELDSQGAYPFGEFFALYDNFYLSSQESFSKKGARINLSFVMQHHPRMMNNDNLPAVEWKLIMKKSDFELPEPPRTFIVKTAWEYWNGKGWVRLMTGPGGEEIFLHQADVKKTMTFICPADIEETTVNDQLNYWIRARVLSIHNMYAPNAVYQTPWLDNIRLQYDYPQDAVPVQQCFAYNNLEYRDCIKYLQNKSDLIRPFYSLDESKPAFYMGFDRPLESGPISIYFSLKGQQKTSGEEMPLLEWEYLRQEGALLNWTRLNVVDETRAFTRSGMVVFAGSHDYCRASIFEQELYWIRVVNRDGRFNRDEGASSISRIKGIYMNTTLAVQQQCMEGEILDTGDGELRDEYILSSSPVLAEEVWINEVRSLSNQEKQDLINDKLVHIRELKDEWGNITEFWIKWTAADDFLTSTPQDRHYCIDRSSGTISFGDGRNGKKPPVAAGKNCIQVKYWIGGGSRGNVPAWEIKQLRKSIAFVGEVFNPEPAAGGCDQESFAEASRRGPQLLKHQNRAVTAADFEQLARQASQNIAQVKCLPNTDGQGRKAGGYVTLVILPRGGPAGGQDFAVLRQDVERYLLQRSAGNLSFSGRIQVIEPLYLEFSVLSILVVDEVDSIARVEQEASKKLNEFLEPALSGQHQKGWKIGQYPHISVFYTLLKAITAVNYVENVSITINTIEDGTRKEIDLNNLADLPHGMVVNGKHRVVVKNR